MVQPSVNFLSELSRIKDVRTARLSSWDQTGRNQDYWMIAPGETVSLGEIEGPGSLTHIWMTAFCRRVLGPSAIDPALGANVAPVHEMNNVLGVSWEAADPAWYRKALLKMYWDDQSHPSVLVPLGDFFCIGHSMPASFSSLPFTVSARPEETFKFGGVASLNCYLPMAFNRNARIEIVNENDAPLGIFFHIDYELYRRPLGDDLAYFHASWHRENPCDGWGDGLQVNTPEVNAIANLDGAGNYVILEAEGQGHYIGCNLSTTHFQGSWWGEGDDMMFIDGEPLPSIVGTGSEDYFNHAWGMQKVAYPFAGSIVNEADVPGYQVSYRFHIADPVYFSKSLKVTMEHGHANHLSDDWSSTAYWYQTLPSKPLTILPAELRVQRMPEVPKAAKPAAEPYLTEEMQASFRAARRRMKEYEERREAELAKKIGRTPANSRGNTEAARNVSDAYRNGSGQSRRKP